MFAAILTAGDDRVATIAEIFAALQAEGKVNSRFGHYKHVAGKSGLSVEDFGVLIHMGKVGGKRAGRLLVD